MAKNLGDWTESGANWVDIDGAVGGEYAFAVSAEHGKQMLRAVARNSAGEAVTEALSVLVVSAPSFVTQPKSVSVDEGDTVLFTTEVAGLPKPTVEWFQASAQRAEPMPSTPPSRVGLPKTGN